MILLESNAAIEITDLGVTIATVLFALSLISERISNLIKLHFGRLSLKKYEVGLEKERELYIMWLAIGCGILTAFLAGADLFTLLNSGKLINSFDLFSKPETNGEARAILGIVLSGAFISMGSKFWHDVLDIVLQFSALKKYKVDQSMTETKYHVDLSNEASRIQLIRKTDNIIPRLRTINGYSGYDVVEKEGKVVAQLKFMGALPTKAEQKWINDYYSPDKVEFQQLTSKAGLHATSSR